MADAPVLSHGGIFGIPGYFMMEATQDLVRIQRTHHGKNMKLSTHVVQPHMVASFLMNDIARMCRQLVDQKIRDLDLTRAQWYLLNYIFLYEGLSQQELADLADLGKSNVAKQIHSLEQKGFVRRGLHETDGRSFRVYMTQGASKTVRKLNLLVEHILRNILDTLNEGEKDTLIALLRRIDQNLDKELRSPAPGGSQRTSRLLASVKEDLAAKLKD